MKIAMVGSGYVGLVSGACFADFGHEVVCIDKDESKIARLKDGIMPIYEPGLDALVESNVNAGRLSFTTDLGEGIKGASAIFIAPPARKRPLGSGWAMFTSPATSFSLALVYWAPDWLLSVTQPATSMVFSSFASVTT